MIKRTLNFALTEVYMRNARTRCVYSALYGGWNRTHPRDSREPCRRWQVVRVHMNAGMYPDVPKVLGNFSYLAFTSRDGTIFCACEYFKLKVSFSVKYFLQMVCYQFIRMYGF